MNLFSFLNSSFLIVMKDSGYLLSYVRYGDNDVILHCFTKTNGFQSFFVRGIYSAKSKKKAYLAPLNELVFTISEQNKAKLPNIKKIEQVKSIDCGDVRTASVVFFIAEFLYQVLKSETRQEMIYASISDFLSHLEAENYQSYYAFMINFLAIQGIAPLVGEGNFLNPEMGCFEHQLFHQYFNEEVSKLWKAFLIQDDVYSIKIKNHLKADFLDTILLYYAHHFPDFKFPKSLEVLKEIFD